MPQDKERVKAAAEWCEQEGQAALMRGLDFMGVAGGNAVSGQADFERAGCLLRAADELNAMAKAKK